MHIASKIPDLTFVSKIPRAYETLRTFVRFDRQLSDRAALFFDRDPLGHLVLGVLSAPGVSVRGCLQGITKNRVKLSAKT